MRLQVIDHIIRGLFSFHPRRYELDSNMLLFPAGNGDNLQIMRRILLFQRIEVAILLQMPLIIHFLVENTIYLD